MRTILLISILFASLSLFGVTLHRSVMSAPADAIDVVSGQDGAYASASTTPEQIPVRLRVPSLGIDAPVTEVGINAKGEMAVPAGYQEVGWYRYGTVPGHGGSAVLAGHVDNSLSLAGVFKRLGEAAPGTDVEIETAEGRRLQFVVDRTARYGYRDVPMAALTAQDGPARLALITCAGSWLRGERTYDERVVVYATLVLDEESRR